MNLQINTAGAWKNVVTFDADRREDVIAALRPLAEALDGAKFCLVDDAGEREWLELP